MSEREKSWQLAVFKSYTISIET